jgi:hypothetical protein
MPGFVQIMEFETSRIDEVIALIEKMRVDRGDSLLSTAAKLTADRDRPGSYVNIIEFDSYEAAMENSNDPATSEFAQTMGALLDGPPRFLNLDVRLEM